MNGEHYHIIEFFRDKIALRKIPPLQEHPYNKRLVQGYRHYRLYKPPKTVIKQYGLYFAPCWDDIFNLKAIPIGQNNVFVIRMDQILLLLVVTTCQIV